MNRPNALPIAFSRTPTSLASLAASAMLMCSLCAAQDAAPKEAAANRESKRLAADFVFLIDGTDSMAGEIAAVKRGLTAFVAELGRNNVDARFAIVLFGGAPELVLDFTASVDRANEAFGKISVSRAVSGFQESHNVNPEAGLEAIRTVLGKGDQVLRHKHVGGDGKLIFRNKARKNLVVITDEDSDLPFHQGNRLAGQESREPPVNVAATDWQREVDATARAIIASGAYVNLLINPDDKPSRLQYGDPESDASDKNLLGFDPKATLTNLERNRFKDCLEAQVLRSGLIARSFNIRKVDDPNFVKSFFQSKVEEVVKGGSPTTLLRVTCEKGRVPLSTAAAPQVELILDSSYSMSGNIEEQTKLQIARNVVQSVLADLPAGFQVGLRLYGHWGPWVLRRTDPNAPQVDNNDPRLNTDSQLVVQISSLTEIHRNEIKKWLDWTRPRGKTPLVYSLLQAIKDFPPKSRNPRIVVLVSDGKETCGGKLGDVAKVYRGAKIGAVIHVVGFDVENDAAAKKQLEEIARLGGGKYFNVNDDKQLTAALKEAIGSMTYVVMDAGRVVGRGTVNCNPLELGLGPYDVQIEGAESSRIKVELKSERSLQLVLDETGKLVQPKTSKNR